jgi:peptidoglycan biosynthesis protein MviN/MurJ (putative lipid II flippase)
MSEPAVSANQVAGKVGAHNVKGRGYLMKFFLYFPFLAIVLAAYNVAMLAGVDFEANPAVFHIPHMTRETPMTIGAADLIVGVGIVLLFLEIVKAARMSRSTVVDHMLSMAVFIVFLVELIVAAGAGTAAFMLLTLLSLIDLVAGFTISIATARRDFSIGGGTIG